MFHGFSETSAEILVKSTLRVILHFNDRLSFVSQELQMKLEEKF